MHRYWTVLHSVSGTVASVPSHVVYNSPLRAPRCTKIMAAGACHPDCGSVYGIAFELLILISIRAAVA